MPLECNQAPSTGGLSTWILSIWITESAAPRHISKSSHFVHKYSAEYNEIWHIINTPYAETAHNAKAGGFFEGEKKTLLQLLFGAWLHHCSLPSGEGAAKKNTFCVTLWAGRMFWMPLNLWLERGKEGPASAPKPSIFSNQDSPIPSSKNKRS